MPELRFCAFEFPFVLLTCDIETRADAPFSAFLYDGFRVAHYDAPKSLCEQMQGEASKPKLLYVIDRYGTARERFDRWIIDTGIGALVKIDGAPEGMDAHMIKGEREPWFVVFFKVAAEVVIPTIPEYLTEDLVKELDCVTLFRDYIHGWMRVQATQALEAEESAKADA